MNASGFARSSREYAARRWRALGARSLVAGPVAGVVFSDDDRASLMLKRLGLLVAVSALLGAMYALGLFDVLTDRERFRALIVDLGMWGPVVYVLSFALLEPFFVPGIAFMAPGALVWSFPELFVYSLLGASGAGVVGFSFARYLARDWVETRMPARLRAWDERLARAGFRNVVVVRLTLFLAPPAHWMLGLSKVRFPTFVAGTVVGFAPAMLVLSWVLVEVGGTLWDWMASRPGWVWIVLVAGVVVWIVVRRRLAARRHARIVAGTGTAIDVAPHAAPPPREAAGD